MANGSVVKSFTFNLFCNFTSKFLPVFGFEFKTHHSFFSFLTLAVPLGGGGGGGSHNILAILLPSFLQVYIQKTFTQSIGVDFYHFTLFMLKGDISSVNTQPVLFTCVFFGHFSHWTKICEFFSTIRPRSWTHNCQGTRKSFNHVTCNFGALHNICTQMTEFFQVQFLS